MRNILSTKLDRLILPMFKYFWVAVVAAIVDYLSFMVACTVLGLNVYFSNTLAFMLGLVANYTLAIKFVFQGQSDKSIREFIAFTLIGVVGLGISNLAIYMAMNFLLLGLSFAKCFAITATFFWNFGARKFLLFNKENENGA